MPADAQPAAPKPVPRKLVLLLAVSCGLTVANLYYAQPLLSAIGDQFGVSDGTAGLLVTVSQIFYGLGIVFLAPLSDLSDRRRLVAVLLVVSCFGMAGAAAAPSFAVLALALGIASATSVVCQILVPFASTLAPEGERGHVVGMVMSGLLSGLILGRTFAGLLAEAAGWRTVFALAAVAMALLCVLLWRAMPQRRPSTALAYRELLGSVASMVRREAVLRRRMIYGACGFAGFSLVWTTLSFLLSDPPFNFGEATIGLFGLAGLGGTLAATWMGRLHDRGLGRIFTGVVLAAVVLSWPIFYFGRHSVPAILVGLAMLDFGTERAEPGRHLRARPRDHRPRHHRLRDLELRRRRDRLGGRLDRLERRRLGRRLRRRPRLRRDGDAGLAERAAAERAASSAAPASVVGRRRGDRVVDVVRAA
jgi:predicted MFS family arabinose efflux permease